MLQGVQTTGRAEKVARRLVACLIAGLLVLTGIETAEPADAAGRKFEVSVGHKTRLCRPGGMKWVGIRLVHAPIAVTVGGRTVRDRLDDRGIAELKLKGKGDSARVELEYEDDLLAVKPWGESDPYTYTEKVKLDKQKRYRLDIERTEDAGAASVWSTLREGAELARTSMPPGVRLPKVTARYASGGGPSSELPDYLDSTSSYLPRRKEIRVDSREDADEFDRQVLFHEYGHHLLWSVAPPGASSGGEHSIDEAYPTRPALAWDEGFADAFTAIFGGPLLGNECDLVADLSQTPARPPGPTGARDDRYNQFNEAAVAGALYELLGRLGNGERSNGLQPLLSALYNFNALYGGPESVREARDALIESGLEESAEDHQELDELFARQGIGWGFDFYVGPADNFGDSEYYEVQIVGPEPYGTCEWQGNFDRGDAPEDWGPSLPNVGAFGWLDHAWQDECYTNYWGVGSADIPYPAPEDAGNPETALWLVEVRWWCYREAGCPAARDARLDVARGAWVRNSPNAPVSMPWWFETWDSKFSGEVFLARDEWVRVAEFNAAGYCRTFMDGAEVNCSN